MVNKSLYIKENRIKFKEKVLKYCLLFKEIDQDKIDIYHSEEDNQISIWLFKANCKNDVFDNACNEVYGYIEDELDIVCDELVSHNINNCDCYQIIIFYDEISNESEEIINEILYVLSKYNKKIDIQYDDDSACISWY